MSRLFAAATIFALLTGCFRDASFDRSCWMKFIPDDMPAYSMSIPGAHDACTAGVDEEYAYFRTQALDVKGLWDAGVRSFDIRPTAREDHLGVFHQMADTHVTFEGVVSTLDSCLREHPSEFAVVIFRHEDDADLSDNFGSLMGEFLQNELPEGLSIDFKNDLTLGELRGHILFLSRAKYENGPVGAYIERWSEEGELVNAVGDRAPMSVQDYYDPAGKDDKLAEMTKAYESNLESHFWTVNHTSAYVVSGYGENSQNVNSDFADLIIARKGKTGIVVMDFAGVDTFEGWNVAGRKLVDAVIDNNFE